MLNLRSELTNARGQKREFTYDALGRIVSEVNLDKNDKAYYTYDSLSRVTSKNAVDSTGAVISTESYTYDDAGNMTYGYLGSAMGIGDVTLYWGGGVASQGLKNIFSEEERDASKYYGDTKEDHNAIKKGINFYYDDYPNSKPGINRTFP